MSNPLELWIIALFPELLTPLRSLGIVGRAVEEGLVVWHDVQIRDFSTNKHRTVDDGPYGGGSGMVMMAPPVVSAIESVAQQTTSGARPHTILLTPTGRVFNQSIAQELSERPALAFVCGRYEGIDDRVRAHVDDELSLGDYVLTGGEIAAGTIIDSVVRLLPGALGNSESALHESHGSDGVLEHPHYTRPFEFRGEKVPATLLSGDHARIDRWRRWHSLRRTRALRPDLFARLDLGPEDLALIDGDEP